MSATQRHAMIIHFPSALLMTGFLNESFRSQLVYKHGAGVALALPDLDSNP